jgi:hypothetical protein
MPSLMPKLCPMKHGAWSANQLKTMGLRVKID